MGIWDDIAHAVTGIPSAAYHIGSDVGKGVATVGNIVLGREGGPTTDPAAIAAKEAAKAKAPAKKKATAATTTGTEAKVLESAIATGPLAKIMQSVATEYKVAQSASSAAASGSLTAPATQGAWAEALQSLAGTPAIIGETPSKWLGENLATAQKVDAPLTGAMNAYGEALAGQQTPILKNIAAIGQGNELGVVTAPENAWLNALGSHVTSNLSYYGTVPTAAVSSLPSSVIKALQASGGYPGSTAKGLTPLGSLTTKGTTPKVKAGTTTVGGTLAGTVPGASSTPGG